MTAREDCHFCPSPCHVLLSQIHSNLSHTLFCPFVCKNNVSFVSGCFFLSLSFGPGGERVIGVIKDLADTLLLIRLAGVTGDMAGLRHHGSTT